MPRMDFEHFAGALFVGVFLADEIGLAYLLLYTLLTAQHDRKSIHRDIPESHSSASHSGA
jgi:hypothetical protein